MKNQVYSNLLFSFAFLLFLMGCNEPKEIPKDSVLATKASVFEVLSNNANIDKAWDSLVEQSLVPLVYARIEAADGKTIYEHNAVNPTLYPELRVDKDSWFRVWSMSKIVTIAIVMDLVEEGLLQLEHSVSQYIPEFKDLQVAVTADGSSIIDLPWDQLEQVCPIQLVPSTQEMTVG